MVVAEEGRGMLCYLCRKHSLRSAKARVRRAVWVDIPCRTLTRLSLVKHAKSESHCFAVQMEADLCSPKKMAALLWLCSVWFQLTGKHL